MENTIPKEVFMSIKLDLIHLRIFVCLVYIHISKYKRNNLDPTRMKETFFGYSNASKAYRIYIKEGQRIEVRQDVIFDESIAFKKSKDLLIDCDDEELPIFEECPREEEDSNHEEEGPSELV